METLTTDKIMDAFNKMKDEKIKSMPIPGKPIISTISAKSFINRIDKKDVEIGELVDKLWENKKMLDALKYKDKNHNYKEGKSFNNCCNIIFKGMNIKMFSKGKLIIAGIKSEKDIIELIAKLESFLNEILDYKVIVDKPDIIMINSNFNCGYNLDRGKLYKLIKNKINVVYGNMKYPAVKINFMYNTNQTNIGCCNCTDKIKCMNKKKNCNGDGDIDCKKIMISIFQTGSIIISGAKNMKQLNCAYEWITQILKENYAEILHISIADVKI